MARRQFHQLQYADRIRIETLLRRCVPKKEIADIIGVHWTTIYNEIKRGLYEHRNSDYTVEIRYSCDIAEARYQANLRAKGADLKIGKDHAYADYIEHKICDEKYSVDAALQEALRLGFKTSVTRTTIYSYIDKGIFLRLTNKFLPVRGKRKKKKVVRAKSVSIGTSIEKRPKTIYSRKDFGHWEMDLVVGKARTRAALVVMTERKTRGEIIRKIPTKEAKNVVKVIDELERKYGKMFHKIFKTITVDNGVEFTDVAGLERGLDGGQRVAMFYCHPYCASERGSNENANKLIRRHFPKGTDFTHVSEDDVQRVEDWVNNYPRRLHGWHTAAELFQDALNLIS